MQARLPKAGWGMVTQLILGSDPQQALQGELIVWFHKVDLFRHEEESRMYRQAPNTEDLAQHKSLLLRLIEDGEHLARLIERLDLKTVFEGTTLEDLRATLRILHADYRGWHEPMAEEQRTQILREVFDGTKSCLPLHAARTHR